MLYTSSPQKRAPHFNKAVRFYFLFLVILGNIFPVYRCFIGNGWNGGHGLHPSSLDVTDKAAREANDSGLVLHSRCGKVWGISN